MKALAVSLAIAVCACACAEPRSVKIKHFGSDTPLVESAVADWYNVGAGLYVTDSEDADIVVKVGPTRAPCHLVGQTKTWTNEVQVNTAKVAWLAQEWERPVNEVLRAVVLHELGHALGLEHHSVGIMRAPFDYTQPDRLDVIDRFTVSLLEDE